MSNRIKQIRSYGSGRPVITGKGKVKHYYMTFVNDDLVLCGTQCPTVSAAIQELKESYRADFEDCDGEPGNDYYITEFYETETAVFVSNPMYYELCMGPRGGVHCKRVSNP